ncbi:hypothetical protein NQZ68_023155 [Dissostichus eleginoides]|nr:hypothetical protein NQZ68_023155 [Dissostichus eleginoides]
MSAGGVQAGLPVTQRKVPFCVAPGVGETPRCTHRKKRLHLLFELWRGRGLPPGCPYERSNGDPLFCLQANRSCQPARKRRPSSLPNSTLFWRQRGNNQQGDDANNNGAPRRSAAPGGRGRAAKKLRKREGERKVASQEEFSSAERAGEDERRV